MNDDSAADDTTINNDEVDSYLLSRLGLLPDEVDWPANSSSSSTSSSASANVPVGEETIASSGAAVAWRVRDALTSLLGTHVSSVKSDSGLTLLEITSLLNEENESALASTDNNNSEGVLTATTSAAFGGGGSSSGSSPMVTIESIVAPFLPPAAMTPVADEDYDDKGGGGRGKFIHAKHVRKAFDAAAYAILRADIQGGGGKKTNHPLPPPPLVYSATNLTGSTVVLSNKTTTTTPTDSNAIKSTNSMIPPLIAAMESMHNNQPIRRVERSRPLQLLLSL
jgi:hypothetical protein